jgi:signal transduction histidine kinase
VKAIVSAHGGSVAVDSEPGSTTVILTLPANSLSGPAPGHSDSTA